ncbi:MAG: FecR family protein [Deltaproteobacteria bacterium]|nr:FecR family protein [Deltaproteobacteria bacterium]
MSGVPGIPGGKRFQRKGWVVLAGVVLAVAGLLPWAGVAAAQEVTLLERPVQVKRKDAKDWTVLNLGDKVKKGDAIRTGMGARVEITLGNKRVFRIGQASEVELPELEGGENKNTNAKVNLVLGRFWAGLLKPLKGGTERFEVQTETATIGVKGTQFGVDFDKESKASAISVITGTVAAVPPPPEEKHEVAGPREIAPPQEITREEWSVLVTRDQKVIIIPGQAPKVVPMTAEDKADDWVKFNTDRDAAIAKQ